MIVIKVTYVKKEYALHTHVHDPLREVTLITGRGGYRKVMSF